MSLIGQLSNCSVALHVAMNVHLHYNYRGNEIFINFVKLFNPIKSLNSKNKI